MAASLSAGGVDARVQFLKRRDKRRGLFPQPPHRLGKRVRDHVFAVQFGPASRSPFANCVRVAQEPLVREFVHVAMQKSPAFSTLASSSPGASISLFLAAADFISPNAVMATIRVAGSVSLESLSHSDQVFPLVGLLLPASRRGANDRDEDNTDSLVFHCRSSAGTGELKGIVSSALPEWRHDAAFIPRRWKCDPYEAIARVPSASSSCRSVGSAANEKDIAAVLCR